MGERVRVRVRLGEVEVDIEGPQEFVEAHRDAYEPLLAQARATASSAPHPLPADEDLFAAYPSSLTDYDRVLAACYHAQQGSEEHAFRWPDASRILLAHGMGNAEAADEFQYLLDARLVLKLQKGAYRVSAKGVEALHQLAAANAPR